MANPRPIGGGLQGLQQAYGQLAQSNAIVRAAEEREEARRRAQDSSQLRMLGTVGGAIVGGVAAGAYSGGMGAPAGAAIGSQIGGTIGGMVSASRGNENYNAGEVNQTVQNYAAYDQQAKQNDQAQKEQERKNNLLRMNAQGSAGNTESLYGQADTFKKEGMTEEEKRQKLLDSETQYSTISSLPDAGSPENQAKLQALRDEREALVNSETLTSSQVLLNKLIDGMKTDTNRNFGVSLYKEDFGDYDKSVQRQRSNLGTLKYILDNTGTEEEKQDIIGSANAVGLAAPTTDFRNAIGYDKRIGAQKMTVLQEGENGIVTPVKGAINVDPVTANTVQASMGDTAFIVPATQTGYFMTKSQKQKEDLAGEKADTKAKEGIVSGVINLQSGNAEDSLAQNIVNMAAPGSKIMAWGREGAPSSEQISIAAANAPVEDKQKSRVEYRAERKVDIQNKLQGMSASLTKQQLAAERAKLEADDNYIREYEDEFMSLLGPEDSGVVLPKKKLGSFKGGQEARDQAARDIAKERVKTANRILKQGEESNLKSGIIGPDIFSLTKAQSIIRTSSTPEANKLSGYIDKKIKERNDFLTNKAKEDDNKIPMQLSLRKEYMAERRRYSLIEEKKGIIEGAIKNADRDGGVADMALIFAYMKMLDPTSVVRESEYATAATAPGTAAWLLNLYNKSVKIAKGELPQGSLFTPESREKFRRQAMSTWGAYQSNLGDLKSYYIRAADTYGLDYKMILDERDWPEEAAQANPAPAPQPDAAPAQQTPPPTQPAPREDLTPEERVKNMTDEEINANLLKLN